MKVIDLLNKIANEEELPKKIKYCYQIYSVGAVGEDYYNYENNCWFFRDKFDTSIINDEVEIIEDNEDLELIPEDELYEIDGEEIINWNFRVLKDKINELVKEINEIRRDK